MKCHVKPYRCPNCAKRAAEKREFLNHLQSCSPDLAAWNGRPQIDLQCPYCPEKIRNKLCNLQRHIERFHENNEPDEHMEAQNASLSHTGMDAD